MTYRDLLAAHAEGPALDRLVAYAELLERWAAVHNLVRFEGAEELVRDHLAEAIADGGPAPGGGVLVDVGSGAGLPGVPRLCVGEAWSGVLVEPRQKRWAFLRLVVRELGLDARVERCRYEDLRPELRGFDSVVSRAVGGQRRLLVWSREHLSPGGSVSLWVGSDTRDDLTDVSGWSVVSSRALERRGGRILTFRPCFT